MSREVPSRGRPPSIRTEERLRHDLFLCEIRTEGQIAFLWIRRISRVLQKLWTGGKWVVVAEVQCGYQPVYPKHRLRELPKAIGLTGKKVGAAGPEYLPRIKPLPFVLISDQTLDLGEPAREAWDLN